MNILSTVSAVKAHMGIPSSDTSKDGKIVTALAGVSKAIEKECNRDFGMADYIEAYSGDGEDELELRHYPVDPDATFTLKIGDAVVDLEAEIAAKKAWIDYEAGIVTRDKRFPMGTRNVEVSYSAGYVLPREGSGESGSDLPADLELAVIRLTSRVVEKSTAEGVVQVGAGTHSINFKEGMDEDIQDILDSYARPIIV